MITHNHLDLLPVLLFFWVSSPDGAYAGFANEIMWYSSIQPDDQVLDPNCIDRNAPLRTISAEARVDLLIWDQITNSTTVWLSISRDQYFTDLDGNNGVQLKINPPSFSELKIQTHVTTNAVYVRFGMLLDNTSSNISYIGQSSFYYYNVQPNSVSVRFNQSAYFKIRDSQSWSSIYCPRVEPQDNVSFIRPLEKSIERIENKVASLDEGSASPNNNTWVVGLIVFLIVAQLTQSVLMFLMWIKVNSQPKTSMSHVEGYVM